VDAADEAAGACLLLALGRRRLWSILGAPHPLDAHRADSRAMTARGRSAAAHEGVVAVLEERPDRR
jgi:hypothetical protein